MDNVFNEIDCKEPKSSQTENKCLKTINKMK